MMQRPNFSTKIYVLMIYFYFANYITKLHVVFINKKICVRTLQGNKKEKMQGARDFFFEDVFEKKIVLKVFQYFANNQHKINNITQVFSIIKYNDYVNSLKYVGVCRQTYMLVVTISRYLYHYFIVFVIYYQIL